MNTVNPLTILVVCSDVRGEELATSLNGCNVLLRSFCKRSKAWKSYRWNPDHKESTVIDDSELPLAIDVLLFHKSDGDPNGIPNIIGFTKEFAFSGAGVGFNENPASRNAIPIQRNILKGSRLIKARHVNELINFVKGTRLDVPSFCLPEVTLSGLTAIAITCQAYAAAGIANGMIRPGNSLYDEMGWDQLSSDALARISSSLECMWPGMQKPQWWMSSLGVSGSNEQLLLGRHALLVQLAKDLDLPIPPEDQSIDTVIKSLVGLLQGHSKDAATLAEFLRFEFEDPSQLASRVFSSVKKLLAHQ
jgi:hypothetical protein